ncbi:hypothetical protein CERSUDRAFT_121781 [Gelatoporia subvermispora B]|uniref:F-box domain-containing protein n=1 Tax=Ceriporiopsis subvermispora (strain B) TaxID=914234 RepID=M2RL37_CERS8|nr:hypothetical protein CERSUDRAFT_121781 [Gelatoporia subvermispora B]
MDEEAAMALRKLTIDPENFTECRVEAAGQARLPTELVILVFDFACPPPPFLKTASDQGASACWSRALRTKKALTHVCKAWRTLALPYLYEDVVLDLSRQVLALARTIRERHPEIGPLIKHVHLALPFPPPEQLPQVTLSEIAFVLRGTPNLTNVTFGTAFSWWYILKSSSSLLRPLVDALSTVGTRLQSLELDVPKTNIDLYPAHSLKLMACFVNLVSLAFPVPQGWGFGEEQDIRGISFPKLEQLQMICTPGGNLRLVISWSLPCLKALTVTGTAQYVLDREQYEDLLEQHGAGVEYLDVSQRPSFHIKHVFETAHLCPKLSHLVITHIDIPALWIFIQNLDHDIAHPSLCDVDFWAKDGGALRSILAFAETSILKNARVLDVDLFGQLRHLPRLVGPATLLPPGEVVTYSLPTFNIVQTRHLITMNGPQN